MEEGKRRRKEDGKAVNGQKPIRRRDRMSSVVVVRHVYLCIDDFSQTPFTTTQDSNVFEPVDKAYAFVNLKRKCRASLILKQVILYFISYSCF